LVVIAIIGILIGLLLPAIQMARESARRADCQSRMRQVAMAVQSYSTQNQEQIPPGIRAVSLYTAQMLILPHLEQTNVYKLLLPFNDAATSNSMAPATRQRLPIFNCPTDNPTGTTTPPWGTIGGTGTYARSNFVFCFGGDDFMGKMNPATMGIFHYNVASSYGSMAVDGASNTMMVSEVISGKTTSERTGMWGLGDAGACGFTCKLAPANTFVAPVGAVDTSPTGFDNAHAGASSSHPGLVNVVFGDNHVATVATSITLSTWRAYGTISGQEAVAAGAE